MIIVNKKKFHIQTYQNSSSLIYRANAEQRIKKIDGFKELILVNDALKYFIQNQLLFVPLEFGVIWK